MLPDLALKMFVYVAQERLRHEEDLEHNNGVWWQERLTAVPLQANVVEQLGIKRSTDKVHVTNCCVPKCSYSSFAIH